MKSRELWVDKNSKSYVVVREDQKVFTVNAMEIPVVPGFFTYDGLVSVLTDRGFTLEYTTDE